MSLIFEALQELESERAGIDSPPQSEAVEFLRQAGRRAALQLEAVLKRPGGEAPRPPAEPEPRPSAVEWPLPANDSVQAGLPGPRSDAPEPAATPAGPAAESRLTLPSGVKRVVAVLRAAMPFVQSILPLLDGNTGAAANLPSPDQPASPVPALPPPADFARIKDSLAELKTRHRELRDQVAWQNAALKRVEDHLEMVREATDRNTGEQQDLIEELKGAGSKINFVVLAAFVLIAASLAINIVLCFRIFNIRF